MNEEAPQTFGFFNQIAHAFAKEKEVRTNKIAVAGAPRRSSTHIPSDPFQIVLKNHNGEANNDLSSSERSRVRNKSSGTGKSPVSHKSRSRRQSTLILSATKRRGDENNLLVPNFAP